MFEVTLVFLGGSVDISRWIGALKAIDESSVHYRRIVASSTAAPFAVLVASGYRLEEIGDSWNDFNISAGKEANSADQIAEWVRGLLELKDVQVFGDLKGKGTPELKLIVRDANSPAILTLPDDAWRLGLQPNQLEIIAAVRASMAIPDLPHFKPVNLGSRQLAGYFWTGTEGGYRWGLENAVRPATTAVWLYSEPIVLGEVRTFIKGFLSTRSRSLLQLDKAISRSLFTPYAKFVRHDSLSRSPREVSGEEEQITGIPRGGKFINLRSFPSWFSVRTDDVLEAARVETGRELRVLGISSGTGRHSWMGDTGEVIIGGVSPAESKTTHGERPGAGIAAPSPSNQPPPPSFPPSVSPQGSFERPPAISGAAPPDDPGGGNGGVTEPLQSTHVFPKIAVSDEHPVNGSTFQVTVSLELARDPKTTGVASVPADDESHELDVHLLLGDESQWRKLTFQRPQGTLEKAVFETVRAPAILPGDGGKVERRIIADIYVNFYLEKRWCGEAVTQIDVRESDMTDKFNITSPPPEPAWRRDLLIAPGTPPPDLLVRIKKKAPMSFEWSLFSPHMVFNISKDDLSRSYDKAPYGFVKYQFEKFASAKIDKDKRYSLKAICDEISRAAPIGFHRAYRDLRIAEQNDVTGRIKLQTIQFVSDEAYIPWELMRVADYSTPRAFEPEILGVQHSVGRWVASDATLRTSLVVKKIVVFATDYAGENVGGYPELPGAKAERDFLAAQPYCATPLPVRFHDLQDYLYNTDGKAELAEIIHFSCHGSTDVQDPDEATLSMEDTNDGFKATLAGSYEAWAGAGTHHPLVFLNACQAAAAGDAFGFVFGWPQAFLHMGATACIAPLWKIVDGKAKDAAKLFYASVLNASKTDSSLSIGEAVQQIRKKWTEEEHLTNLAYVLYGDPTTKLTWVRPSLDSAAKPL